MSFAEQDILAKIKSTLQEHAPEAMAILYGSRARGDARPDSDWDVLVLLNKERIENSDYDRIAYPMYDLGLEIDESISMNLYTKDDWEKRNFTPFYKNVQNDGIKLYDTIN